MGAEKPDKLIFESAIEKVNMHHLHRTAPHRILFVGNETDVDVRVHACLTLPFRPLSMFSLLSLASSL